jgi:uncharacterized protein YehS (DUF1456 family)
MTNNDVLRSIRYILNVSEIKLIEIIALANFKVSTDDLDAFLKQEEEDGYKNCGNKVLAHFLNGLIIYKRGAQEDKPPQLIETITNNVILKKIRVAFQLKDSDLIRFIEKSGLRITKTELSAFFRSPDHRNYRDCGNQFLRNLLKGMAA